MWEGFLPHNVGPFCGLLCLVIDGKLLPLESDFGLSFSDYYLEVHLGARNFPT